MRGGFSGGTIDSFRSQVDAVRDDPVARAALRDRTCSPGSGSAGARALRAPAATAATPRRWRPVKRNAKTGRWVGRCHGGSTPGSCGAATPCSLEDTPRVSVPRDARLWSGPMTPLTVITVTAGWVLLSGGLWSPTRPCDQLLRPGAGPASERRKPGISGWSSPRTRPTRGTPHRRQRGRGPRRRRDRRDAGPVRAVPGLDRSLPPSRAGCAPPPPPWVRRSSSGCERMA